MTLALRLAHVLTLGAALALPPAMLQAEAAAGGAAHAPVLPAITVAPVSRADLVERIYAGGLVQAVETVQVAPLIEGQPIEALLVEVGDRVTAGQVLARLSRTALDLSRSQLLASVAAARATIAQAEAQVIEADAAEAEARRTAERADALRERGNASQTALDQARTGLVSAGARVTVARQSLEAARAQLVSAEAQLANIELNLTRTEVTAPVAGEVIARNAQIGAIASAAGQPMFTLIRDAALELRVELSERDLLRVVPGQAVRLRIPGSATPVAGTVRLVEPTIDAGTRLGHARIRPQDPAALRAGMFADAEILITARTGLALPIGAVSAGPDGTTVMRVDAEGHVSRRTIDTGIRDAGLIEVLSGLSDGEQVVAKAGAFVRDGDRVRPVTLNGN